MARPKKIVSVPEEVVNEPKQESPVSTIEPPKDPVVPTLDLSVDSREVPVRWHPEIRKGICEFCGVLDNTKPAAEQWTLCKHYKNVDVRCLYCPRGTDPKEWFNGRTLKIVERLDRPNILSIFCDDLRCSGKFYSSFKK